MDAYRSPLRTRARSLAGVRTSLLECTTRIGTPRTAGIPLFVRNDIGWDSVLSSSLFYFLLSIFSLLAAGCATSNKLVEQAQLAAARADAAANRAEASAAAAEKAAHDATLAADRVEKTVREDSKAIDADIARINYLLAQQDRRRRQHRKSHRRRHRAPPATGKSGTPTGGMPPTSVRSTDSDK